MWLAVLAAVTTVLASTTAEPLGLGSYLARNYGDPDRTGVPKHDFGQADLNDDGQSEIFVYLTGQSRCGSGGCKLLVLEPTRSSFKVIGSTTITWSPIRILESKSHGWRDIAVTVAGGGERRHEAILPFDGRRYSSNPTMSPSRRATREEPGRVVIAPPPLAEH